jgi:hypothetical protein
MANRNIICILTAGTFQYISAVEAIKALTDERDRISLYASARARTCTDLTSLPWNKTQYIESRARRARLHHYLNLGRFTRGAQRFIKKSGDPDILLLGNLGDHFNVIANEAKPRKVIVLDEGTGTPVAYRKRFAHLTSSKNTVHDQVKYHAKKIVCNGSTAALTSISAFTVFNDLPITEFDEIIVHRFNSLKRNRKGTVVPYTLVLGTPAVQRGMMNIYDYRQMMATIDEQAAHSITYRPHFGEWDSVNSYIPNRWNVERSTQPIESELLTNEIPRQIVGWASSALISARLLVGDIATIHQVFPADNTIREPWVDRLRESSRLVESFDIKKLNESV